MSIVTFLQLFSHKSKTSSKLSVLTSDILHVNVMNFNRNIQRRMKSAGHSILAYLSVQFFRHTVFGHIFEDEYIF